MRRTAGYTWTDYKTNTQITKELKITPILDKLLEYKRNWIQHVNRMPRNRLPRVMKHYSPTSRRNPGRPLKRLLDTWDRNGSTSGPTPWQIYDDDDGVSALSKKVASWSNYLSVWNNQFCHTDKGHFAWKCTHFCVHFERNLLNTWNCDINDILNAQCIFSPSQCHAYTL